MSDDVTGLTNPTRNLRKTAILVQVADSAPAISPFVAAQQTSIAYRGDDLVPVPDTYSVGTYDVPSQNLAYSPARYVYSDDGSIVYIPPAPVRT